MGLSACHTSQKIDSDKGVDSFPLEAQTGDIVLRLAHGYTARFFRQYASQAQQYSHCGIIVCQDSIRWVIHSEWDAQKHFSGVVSEPWESFVEDTRQWAVYDSHLSKQEREQVAKEAKRLSQKQVPFDFQFDTNDTSTLYCSELVAHCLRQIDRMKPLIRPSLSKRLPFSQEIYTLDDITYRMSLIARSSSSLQVSAPEP